MGRERGSLVSIKGSREGLVFTLDDHAEYAEVLAELENLLAAKQANLLSGPDVSVRVRLGERQITKDAECQLRHLFLVRPNLTITDITSDLGHYRSDYDPLSAMKTVTGTVRAGQVIETDGHLLLLGDVNPGGRVRAGGHIFIFGALKGTAHAGSAPYTEAVITAAEMGPTQLRIASVISRSPDGQDARAGAMEFAYLLENQIAVEPLRILHKIRPMLKETLNEIT